MEESLKYFNGDDFRATTWMNKYALKDDFGNKLESSPKDMFKRLAKEFARIEEKYISLENRDNLKMKLSDYGYQRHDLDEEAIYSLFDDFRYIILGGSGLATIGSGQPVSASNCFVIASPEDSITGINKTSCEQQNLMKRRGGVGHDLSKIRPRGTKVNNSALTSSGVVPFMNLFSEATNTIAQEGRRGALMLSINIDHPDSPEFIKAKQDLTKVTGANISVKVTNEFMEAVQNDEDYILRYPIDADISNIDTNNMLFKYNTLVSYNYSIFHNEGDDEKEEIKTIYIKKVKAKEVWDSLMHCAWNTAEPGIMFEDTMVDYSPDGVYDKFRMVSTNPCGEIGMGPYDSCRLIHLNMSSFIDNPYTKDAKLNDYLLYKMSYEATRLADDLIDLEVEAIDRILDKVTKDEDAVEIELWSKIKDTTLSGRRAGLGFTALADAIAMLGLKFDSNKGLNMIRNIMRIIFKAELYCQIDMAITRGSFPDWDKHKEYKPSLEGELSGRNSFFQFLYDEFNEQVHKMYRFGRRNVSWSTVAPTGTVSILAGTSSGIEPVFMLYYSRRRKIMNDSETPDYIDKVGEKYKTFNVIHPLFQEWAEVQNPKYTMNYLANINPEELDKICKSSPWYGSTAPEIDWRQRIRIQGIVQKYTTHSISSTVNLPKETTLEEIADIYTEAWKTGNKGQTIYRDGSREGILNSVDSNEEGAEMCSGCPAPKRPKELVADYHTIKVKGETFIVLIGLYKDKPYEIFAFKPLINFKVEPHQGIITKVKKMHYKFESDYLEIPNLQLTSENEIEKSITLFGSMLLRHGIDIRYIIKTAQKINPIISSFSSAVCRILSKYRPNEITSQECPDCGGKLLHEAGCIRCLDCDYSQCL